MYYVFSPVHCLDVFVTLRLRSAKTLEFCRRQPTASPHPQAAGIPAPTVSPGAAERSSLSLCVERNASKSWRTTYGPGCFRGSWHRRGESLWPSCGETKVPRELQHSDSGGRPVFEAVGKKG